MTENEPGRVPSHVHPDTATSPAVSQTSERVHVVHAGSEPPEWLTELAGRLAPARPNEAVVVVGAPLPEDGVEGLCERLTPALDACRDTHVRLLLLVMSAGAHKTGKHPSAARLICERWGLDVLATAGTALVTPDGALFSPDLPGASGGWWHFSPGADARRVSSHLPIPDWEAAVKRVGRQTVAGHVIEPVPAGLVVRPAGPAPVTAHIRPHAVPPERDRPQLILASELAPAAALAVVMAALPEHVRRSLRLLSLEGRPLLRTGQALADLLGSDVRVAMGAPVATGNGIPRNAPVGDATVEPRMLDATGRPSWRPFARTVLCSPSADGGERAPRVTEWQVSASLRGGTEADVLSLGGNHRVVVTPAGLWIGPHDSEPPLLATARPVSSEGIAVDLGVPNRILDDSVWSGLDTLFGLLEPDVRRRVVMHVDGVLGVKGQEHLLDLTSRYGFRTADPSLPAASTDIARCGADAQHGIHTSSAGGTGLLAWLGTA